jgi:hypothetical protein
MRTISVDGTLTLNSLFSRIPLHIFPNPRLSPVVKAIMLYWAMISPLSFLSVVKHRNFLFKNPTLQCLKILLHLDIFKVKEKECVAQTDREHTLAKKPHCCTTGGIFIA